MNFGSNLILSHRNTLDELQTTFYILLNYLKLGQAFVLIKN